MLRVWIEELGALLGQWGRMLGLSLWLSVFAHFLLGSSWKPRTPRLSWPPWRKRRKGGRLDLLVSQFSGRGRRLDTGSRVFYHLFLFQGDCEDGAPGLPGQPGIPGERVSVGARGSECGGQGPSPHPQSSTLYSILIPKPKSLNPLSGPSRTSWRCWPQSKCQDSPGGPSG